MGEEAQLRGAQGRAHPLQGSQRQAPGWGAARRSGGTNSFLVSALGPALPAKLHLHLSQFEKWGVGGAAGEESQKKDGERGGPQHICQQV